MNLLQGECKYCANAISRLQTTEPRMAANLPVGSVVWVDLGHSYGWWPALLQDKRARKEIAQGDIMHFSKMPKFILKQCFRDAQQQLGWFSYDGTKHICCEVKWLSNRAAYSQCIP